MPTVSLSRTTDRFAGYKIPLMETLRDPFTCGGLPAGAVIVVFKNGSDVLDSVEKPAEAVAFTIFVFVMVI